MAKKRANGEGNIRKRPDRGDWEARFYDEKGKRHSVYGKTQAECRKNLASAINQQTDNSSTDDEDLTLAQWLTIWQKDFLGNVKPGTVSSYEMQVRVHIIPTLGEIKLRKRRTAGACIIGENRQLKDPLRRQKKIMASAMPACSESGTCGSSAS